MSRISSAVPRLFEGDADLYSSFVDAGEIAERFADPDATTFARLGGGNSLILQGRVAEGMGLPDEVQIVFTTDRDGNGEIYKLIPSTLTQTASPTTSPPTSARTGSRCCCRRLGAARRS